MSRPRIVAFVDKAGWCYHTTAVEIAGRLADRFEFDLVVGADRLTRRLGEPYDLLWCRGYSYLAAGALRRWPEAWRKTIYTVTTGGACLTALRLARIFRADAGALGIVAQNVMSAETLAADHDAWITPLAVTR